MKPIRTFALAAMAVGLLGWTAGQAQAGPFRYRGHHDRWHGGYYAPSYYSSGHYYSAPVYGGGYVYPADGYSYGTAGYYTPGFSLSIGSPYGYAYPGFGYGYGHGYYGGHHYYGHHGH
ncbi:MAG: hypothetical protein K2X87_21915 [Gemmataceae bacterium]|nr:hypothetical protein [Gemmataceae bacterium]